MSALIFIPLVAALWCAIPHSQRLAPMVSVLAATCVLCLALLSLASVTGGNTIVIINHWVELDALGGLLLLLIALVYFTASLFSWGYLGGEENEPRRVRLYHANFNLFAFSMLCIPLLAEIGLVWIFVELTTLLSVLLVSYALSTEALEAAWKYMILTLIGATVAVLGVLVLFWALHITGSTDFTWTGLRLAAQRMPHALLGVAFVLLLVGYGAKIGFVPLHTWLPDAHSQAPSPVCAMLSGIETTAVLYVILRLRNVFAADSSLHVGTWFAVIGLVSVGVAALLILQTHDYKRLFAFSTVEHMGIIIASASIFTPAGDAAALWQIITHTASKSFCFYAAGTTLITTQTREINGVRGLLGTSRWSAGALLVGGLAIGGAPPFAVFLSELAIMRAAILAHTYTLVTLLAIFIVVAFCGVLWHVSRMLSGPPLTAQRGTRMPSTCLWALALAAIPVIVLGVWFPENLGRLLESAARVLGA
jgi:hydrogenase-4 component F